jgi:outer membrane immunogenic protein
MKDIGLTALVLCACVAAGSACAADPYTGAYFGANVGYGSGKSHSSNSAANELINKPSGAFGGIQGGYNWRRREVVYGLALDLDAARMHDTIRCPDPSFDCKTEIKAIGNLRGNVGQLVGRYLVYGTAGLSSAHLKVSADNYMGTNETQTTKRTGWTAGLGFARSMGDRSWWQLQYLHTDFGSKDQTLEGMAFKNKITTDTIGFGLNFAF